VKRLYALRGAVQCLNTVDDIGSQITMMYDEILSSNNLDENDIVSIIFSVTDDLDKVNPCSALRKNGRAKELPLFSVQEPKIMEALPGTARVIIHCYLEQGTKTRHIYRNGAEVLRPDRV
jgi:chorismate mutase